MGFFNSLKCFGGFHDWTEWSYKANGDCSQERHCQRSGCTKTEGQLVHQWKPFEYVAADSCEQKRDCARCGAQEGKTAAHHWLEWAFQNEGECNQERACSRCRTGETRMLHNWDVWQYESPTSCLQVRFCRRCSAGREEKAPKPEDHQWSEAQRIDCRVSEQRCMRCHTIESVRTDFPNERHDYEPWADQPDGRVGRRCVDCGNWEYRQPDEVR